MTIWKFPLSVRDHSILMPRGARLLSVAIQGGEPCLWAMVDPSQPRVARRIGVQLTGAEIGQRSLSLPFIGTLLLENGLFVTHVFDLGEME